MPETPINYNARFQQALRDRAARNGTTPDYEASMIVARRANEIVQFSLAPSRTSPHPVEE